MSRVRAKRIRQKRRSGARKANKCVDCCRDDNLPNASYCRVCYLKRTSHRHLGATKRWTELESLLLRQLERCAYTGKPISLGTDASLEHVEPVSRSPSRATDINNLRWVSKEVNLAKRNMTLREFIEMCRSVLVNLGYVVTRRKK